MDTTVASDWFDDDPYGVFGDQGMSIVSEGDLWDEDGVERQHGDDIVSF